MLSFIDFVIFSRCDIPEEPEDEDEALQGPTYKKTFKKQQCVLYCRVKITCDLYICNVCLFVF